MLEVISKSENLAILFASLFALSEALALIPAIGSNAVFQLVANGLRKLSSLFSKPKV